MMNTNQIKTVTDMTASKKKGSDAIPVRHMQFVFAEELPKKFAFDNALATTVFVVFSAVFPTGERFFMDSVRHFRHQVTDVALQKEVVGFIGQEAIHGREHERFNQALVNNGFDVDVGVRAIKRGLGMLRKLSPTQQLACTVAMEHVTANLAVLWLTHSKLNLLSDTKTLAMWQWHALEELEHKSVSYDVYQLVTKDKLLDRVIAVSAVSGVLSIFIIYAWIVVAYKQGCHRDIKDFKQGIGLLFGKEGFLTPLFTRVPDFLNKKFNPRNEDTTQLEQVWREKLLGPNGVINEFYTNNKLVS
jgi:predicted metal-dependent hydrolase